MPVNHKLAREQWARYVHCRDTGHRHFITKANRCEDFFSGMHWDPAVKAELDAQKRPALTINKVLNTLSSIFGEQIETRAEISFRPRYGAPPQNADILSKVVRFIGDENQLNWLRSEVFADGCITSRGYYDVRLGFKGNTAGEVAISRVNPRAVLPDSDASDYDPETWNDVIVTSWVTADDIKVLYNEADAKYLQDRSASVWELGYDSLDLQRDRFGDQFQQTYLEADPSMRNTLRSIRLIDRQHRQLVKMKYFVDPKSGDKMTIPDGWDRNAIAHAVQAGGLIVSDELCKRVRWTVSAEDVVLHDDWSPFKRFSIVPYFPYFRYGRTIGLVESLIDPQELLNKTLSQELHIVNTMANSGWIKRHGALLNMTDEELEQQGARTGLVLDVQGDPAKDIVKIQPNQIPTGLDRLSFKAEQYIKTVSGRGDNQLGLTRPDQSGKLAEEANKASDVSLRKALDNLERTDYLLATMILEMVQEFYTDKRIMVITRDELTGETEEVTVNLPDQESGEVLNDLSLGSYNVVITSQTARRTLEESEFANAMGLKELGVPIPDRFMIENSNMRKKGELIKAMDAEAASEEGQLKKQALMTGLQLDVAEKKGKVTKLEADATHARAKAAQVLQETQGGDAAEQMKAEAEVQKKRDEMALKEEAHEQEMRHEREMFQLEMELKKAEAAEKRRAMRMQAAATAVATAKAAKQPGASGGAQQAGAAASPAV